MQQWTQRKPSDGWSPEGTPGTRVVQLQTCETCGRFTGRVVFGQPVECTHGRDQLDMMVERVLGPTP